MRFDLLRRAFGLACVIAIGSLGLPLGAAAKEPHRSLRSQSGPQGGESSLLLVRVKDDGRGCRGTVRLRPLRGGQIDMSRFVTAGYVMSFDSMPHLQGFGDMLVKMATLKILSEAFKSFEDQFVPIAPEVLTSIAGDFGKGKSWMGRDMPTLFEAETRVAKPVRVANVIDVRPGEILDAGTLDMRSDDVGFFEPKTATVVAMPATESEQAELREPFGEAGM